MKRMLINATQQEELRMALVDGQRLYDLNIEQPARERKKANIYKGKITRIEPSLEAAFVNYGAERHGFLPLKEISSEYFLDSASTNGGRTNIKDVLREGQDIVVQIDKEERGNKGAALTTFVSLAGRFIVLKPNKPRSGGVSRRITGEDRDLARESLDAVEIPDGMSVILRTAGIDRGPEELAWDLENLLGIWESIKKVVVEKPSPFLIYQERDAVVKALRDYMSNDIGEVLIDNPAVYKEARDFIDQVMPHNLRKLKPYEDSVPLFTRFQIESQIESAFSHNVNLPSGGSIVIDHTEALISIDINSARATKGDDIESTALNTNLEAADEIARQLRLRDLGGLIVIDFIDMGPQKNQRAVESRLRDAVRIDRARVQIGKISRFGLLEMSRQRLRPSLGESTQEVCPRCSGMGNVRGVESLALAILRLVGEEARKERTSKVIAQLPADVATYLLNEKREWVQSLEDNNDVQIVLVANQSLQTPHYTIRRVRDDQTELPENTGASYKLTEGEDDDKEPTWAEVKGPGEVAAVIAAPPATPAPPTRRIAEEPAPPRKVGIFVALWRYLFGTGDDADAKPKGRAKKKKATSRRSDRKGGRDARGGGKKSTKSTSKRGKRQADANDSGGTEPKGKRKAKKKTKKRAAGDGSGARGDKPKRDETPRAEASESSGSDGARKRRTRRSRGRRRRGSGADDGTTANAKDTKASDKDTGDRQQSAATASTSAREPAKASGGNAKSAERDDPARTRQGDAAAARLGEKPGASGNGQSGDAPAKSGSDKAAAKPTKPSKPDAGERRDTSSKGEQERLLPWESAPGKPAKTFTVWSSDDNSS